MAIRGRRGFVSNIVQVNLMSNCNRGPLSKGFAARIFISPENLFKIMEENQIKDGKSELCTFATANSEGKISWHYFSSKLGCHQTGGLLDCTLDAEEVQFVEGLL